MSPYTGNRKWKGEVGLCCLAGFFLLLAVLCLAVYIVVAEGREQKAH